MLCSNCIVINHVKSSLMTIGGLYTRLYWKHVTREIIYFFSLLSMVPHYEPGKKVQLLIPPSYTLPVNKLMIWKESTFCHGFLLFITAFELLILRLNWLLAHSTWPLSVLPNFKWRDRRKPLLDVRIYSALEFSMD